MNVYLLRAGLLLASALSLASGTTWGANHGSSPRVVSGSAGNARSQFFLVTAPTTELAREVCEAAERFRRELAIEWLGQELPPWRDVCPIHVTVGPHLGAGGATSFKFSRGEPREWQMQIQGSRERILDSVLPHEICHTIFATHFGRPLPRWADEGAATSVEHASERSKQDQLLIQFLKTDRGIAFNHMFAMKEYPRDILPLYSQGYSLARYLIALGGKRKFVEYVGDGMQWNNWTAATQRHYGISSLHDLQITWLDWVRRGSPPVNPLATQLAQTESVVPPSENSLPAGQPMPGGLAPLPSPVTPSPPPHSLAASHEVGSGWYRRVRDEAQRGGTSPAAPASPIAPDEPTDRADATQQLGRPQPPQGPRQTILQWERADQPRAADGSGTLWR